MFYTMLSIAILTLILEIFIPAFFFLSFSISAFICTILAYYSCGNQLIIITFSILSVLSLVALRPIFIKIQKNIKQKTGIEEKYVGKTAKVVENIDKNNGVISIYDERWQARNIEDDIIPKGSTIEIVGNESIIMKVRKI